MYPILFTIFGFPVHSFGLMVAIGFGVGAWRMLKIAPRYNISSDRAFDFIFTSLIAGIIGSRLLYVIINHSDYTLKTMFQVWNGGLSFHGGLILGIIAGWIFAKIYKLNFLTLLDMLAPTVCIGYAFGRIGCFLNGCCYGIETTSCIGIPMQTDSGIIMAEPTQLYSVLAGITMFLILRKLEFTNKKVGFIFVNYILMYGLYRFIIEFFRYHMPKDYILKFITQGQFISIIMFAVALIVLLINYREPKK